MTQSFVQQALLGLGVEEAQPTPSGELISRCPLPEHDDNSPSFAVNKATGLWRCYGCKAKGSLAQLAVRLRGISLREAIQGYANFESLEDASWPEPLPPSRKNATKQYLPEAQLAMYSLYCPEHMRDRGYTASFLKTMQIGFDFDSLRVVFPVRDVSGGLVGITRRAIGQEQPKYLHTKFAKGSHLYLGHLLNDYDDVSGREKLLFISEGHTDALRLTLLGQRISSVFSRKLKEEGYFFGGAVATMGGPPTRDQARLCARASDTVALAFDNDTAGGSFELDALDKLLDAGVRYTLRMNYAGKDPDSLSGNDTFELERL